MSETIPGEALIILHVEDNLSHAELVRADSYLVKPLEFTKFDKLLKELVYYWLAWNKSPTHQVLEIWPGSQGSWQENSRNPG